MARVAVCASLVVGCAQQPSSRPGDGVTSVRASAGAPGTATKAAATTDPTAVVMADAGAEGTKRTAAPGAASSGAVLELADAGPLRVVDLHVDVPWQVHFKGRALPLRDGHVTPAGLRHGGYAGIVFPIYLPDEWQGRGPTIADADGVFATIERLVASDEIFHLASRGPTPAGKVAVFVSIEGAGAFAVAPAEIERFIARGVKLIGPVHAADNALASSATGASGGKRGLTEMGKAFSERVYRAGGLIDVSHMSDAAFADLVPIAAAAGAPIVATHSNARAVAKHKRNLTDEQLRVIAETGGVAGLNLHQPFVKGPGARLGDVVAQARHMIATAGIDHVALGSDYDGATPVEELGDAARLPRLADALRAAGLSEADLRKLFGANAVRILGWRPRAPLDRGN
jgi:membrane dipeptidase